MDIQKEWKNIMVKTTNPLDTNWETQKWETKSTVLTKTEGM